MKKRFLPILLAAALIAATPAQAFASCVTLIGVTNFTPADGYADNIAMTVLRSNSTEQISLYYTDATPDTYYMLTISNTDSGADPFKPTSANVVGMDMFKATSTSTWFTLTPNLTAGSTYYVYISTGSCTTSTSGVETWTYVPAVKVASFVFTDSPIQTGDLNDDGNLGADDVRTVLSHITGSITTPLTAIQKIKADTNNDGKITVADAYLIHVANQA